MTRRSRPWLLPVVCAVLGTAWVLWLAHDREPAPEQSVAQAPVTQSTSASPLAGPSAVHPPAAIQAEAKPTPIPPSGARAAGTVPSASAPAVQLGFQTPAGATIGGSFDIRVAIDASQPVARIEVEVTYDPAFLKGRTLEEIDYAQRAEVRAFRIDEINDGHARLKMVMDKGEVPRMNVALVQFEALAPGRTQIRIDSVSVTDASGRPLTWSATGQESSISLN